MKVTLSIDDSEVVVEEGRTVLEAAQSAGIYIPALCSHPALSSSREVGASEFVYRGNEVIRGDRLPDEFDGCQLCVVAIEGNEELSKACKTRVTEGMVVHTNTPQLLEKRRQRLSHILTTHPHVCLICPESEGCIRVRCSQDVPWDERCCDSWGHCELQAIAKYVGVSIDVPRYVFRDLPRIKDEPLFDLDYNLCIGCTRCVRVCQEIRGVGALGFVYQEGQVIVGTRAATLKDSGCRFCGACAEVCPTGTLSDKNIKWAEREANLVPCRSACPAGIDVPRYIDLISRGKFAESLAIVRERVPFPAVLGHVCFHPCEDACRRSALNEPIAICALKRFAAEQDVTAWQEKSRITPVTGKKVAIVGSGPAGLTAGYYLAKLGHSVTVFEALPHPGGMMRVGIPQYRLPREILDAEIDEIRSIGVEIKTNARVASVDELFQRGYDAVFLAIGAHQGIKMGIEGEDSPGVIDCLSFLRDVNLGNKVKLGHRVAVIGGGNAAIDSARTALRLGSSEVTIIYRRSREQMPASSGEIEAVLDEGGNIVFLAAPNRISRRNGALSVECIRMELGEPDASGRQRPTPIAGSEFTMDFDAVIMAIGEKPEIPEQFKLATRQDNTIQVNANTLATTREGVFAGGDVVTGPASVVDAIAAGRRAATSIDKYLGGKGIVEETLVETGAPGPWLGREADFADRHRVPMPTLPINKRLASFAQVEAGFDESEAINEAKRCLKCHLRFELPPAILPPEKWLSFDAENISQVPALDGVYQLLDEVKDIIYIKGTMNLRQELEAQLQENMKCHYFTYEEEPMYTKRETELIQQFLQKYSRLPEQNDDLADLI